MREIEELRAVGPRRVPAITTRMSGRLRMPSATAASTAAPPRADMPRPLFALHLRHVLPGDDVLPFPQLLLPLPGRGHRQLEHPQRLGQIPPSRGLLRGRPSPPPLP